MGASQPATDHPGRRTVVVSGGGSARDDFGMVKRPAAAVNEVRVRNRRRLCMVRMEAFSPLTLTSPMSLDQGCAEILDFGYHRSPIVTDFRRFGGVCEPVARQCEPVLRLAC